MTISDSSSSPSSHPSSSPSETARQPPSVGRHRRQDLLHYLAYFSAVGALTFIAQTDEPKQAQHAILTGAIASGAVVSRDWYKARLDPDMATDPTGFIGLFSKMLHVGRAQANTNAAQLKRVEFLQADLIEAMRDFNDMLRLEPAEVEQKLQAIQTAHLTSALPPNLPTLNVPYPPGTNGVNNAADADAGVTHIPDSTTVRQSGVIHRPGFDA